MILSINVDDTVGVHISKNKKVGIHGSNSSFDYTCRSINITGNNPFFTLSTIPLSKCVCLITLEIGLEPIYINLYMCYFLYST